MSHPRVHVRFSKRTAAVIVAAVLATSGCGDDGTSQPEPAPSSGSESSTDGGGISDDDPAGGSSDDVDVSDRPEWLPVWLLLPDGLELSASSRTPGTGEAGLTGSIPGSDADALYDDAVFMAQSGGYLITDEFEAGARGFNAEHTSDGSRVVFTVAVVADDVHQWSWEFSGLDDDEATAGGPEAAAGASDVGLEPLERRGNLTVTVTSPRVSSRIDGACNATNSRVEFLSDDESTRFIVFTGDAVGGAGEITADVEGEALTWVAAADSETSTAQTSRTDAYYEGDFIQGSEVVFAVVQIRCEE